MSDEPDVTIEEIVAMTEALKERRRRLDIQRGLPMDRPQRTVEQIRAETIALRAENDQMLAERDGAWRTYD